MCRDFIATLSIGHCFAVVWFFSCDTSLNDRLLEPVRLLVSIHKPHIRLFTEVYFRFNFSVPVVRRFPCESRHNTWLYFIRYGEIRFRTRRFGLNLLFFSDFNVDVLRRRGACVRSCGSINNIGVKRRAFPTGRRTCRGEKSHESRQVWSPQADWKI